MKLLAYGLVGDNTFVAGGATIALGRFLTSLRSNPGVTDVARLLETSQADEPEVAQRRKERLEKAE